MKEPLALAAFLVLALVSSAGCQRRAPVPVRGTRVGPDRFRDTVLVTIKPAERRNFALQAGQRDSLRALIARERQLWRATAPRDYRFLLRVACFCPGLRGWLSVEVRGQDVQAWDSSGKPVRITEDTFSIDVMFDNIERLIEGAGAVNIGFDPQWHFPTYVWMTVLPYPDAWSTYEARALKPM